nr:S46 family peptidase [Bacteroidota bacterium]
MNKTYKGLIIVLLMMCMVLRTLPSKADEGMWMLMMLKSLNEGDMQSKGCKLTADQIYNINNSSLKDAIVHFGGFCTGEVISDQGLVITNHHCGFGSIQEHSSVEHDYLTDGYWAKTKADELPNPGLYVRFLVRMEDVTQQVLSQLSDTLNETQRRAALPKIYEGIKKAATKDTWYEADVRSFFKDNEYYLLVYEKFDDVRLVGAPPRSIGEFGGDTDNWMWPRHTGDFSMFRIYCGKDGKPAKYSPDNVPYKPKHFLPVSMAGVKDGDFSMILGYPGRTDRYLTSEGVATAVNQTSPAVVKIRTSKLAILKTDMDADKKVSIQYASKYKQSSNYWKYFIGQTKQLKRMRVFDQKLEQEKSFLTWANGDGNLKAKFGNTISEINAGYTEQRKYNLSRSYFNEAVLQGPEIMGFSFGFSGLEKLLADKTTKPEDLKKETESLKKNAAEFYKDYNAATDQKLFAGLMKMYYNDVPKDQMPPLFIEMVNKNDGDFNKMAMELYKKSMFDDSSSVYSFLENPSAKKIKKDAAYNLITDFMNTFNTQLRPKLTMADNQLAGGYRKWVAGLRQMNPNQKFYPDANSTMRLSYGTVKTYDPMDAVKYSLYTTLDGIIEKMDNDNPEFVVPDKLFQLWKNKDYGPYAENGVLKVCFITNNDITGGNSGSGVVNGNGELIGLAFDGNWEAMSGDIKFDDNYKRCINVDIRYVLFVIDKFAGAGHLVKEMKLVN